jgi:hypothetical protein
MKPPGRLRARDAMSALMRATLGTRPDVPSSTDLGSQDQLPKLSTLSPAQRRAIFAKHRRPPPK